MAEIRDQPGWRHIKAQKSVGFSDTWHHGLLDSAIAEHCKKDVQTVIYGEKAAGHGAISFILPYAPFP